MTEPFDPDETKAIPVTKPGEYRGASANGRTEVFSLDLRERAGVRDDRVTSTDPGRHRTGVGALEPVRDLPRDSALSDWARDSQWGPRDGVPGGGEPRVVRAHRDPEGKQRPRPGFGSWLAGFCVVLFIPPILYFPQMYALPAVGLKALPAGGYFYVVYTIVAALWLWGTALDWRRGRI